MPVWMVGSLHKICHMSYFFNSCLSYLHKNSSYTKNFGHHRSKELEAMTEISKRKKKNRKKCVLCGVKKNIWMIWLVRLCLLFSIDNFLKWVEVINALCSGYCPRESFLVAPTEIKQSWQVLWPHEEMEQCFNTPAVSNVRAILN